MGVQILLLMLVKEVPYSCLYVESGDYDPDTLAMLLLCTILTLCAYFFLQGSDPGYLSAGISCTCGLGIYTY